ncbi:MAG: glucose-1-phosphate adenylyltransferase [Anaerovoracaceae bacterium]|jgi:glucose-1-phosphate adenylyltransferase
MNRKKKCIAMLLAGGQGSRLAPLTSSVAKPAIPFGSKYRIIDFSLSNCVNSEIDTVGVLTQYQPLALNDYIATGSPWDLNRSYGGVHVLPPYQGSEGGDWYMGTANAVYQNINFIQMYSPDYVLILSGDHIYKMDYSIMLQEHIENEADCTIAVIDVDIEEASRFGIMNTDSEGRILEFEEKPAHPKSTSASMGVYIFNTDILYEYLEADNADPNSEKDFGKNVIPSMLSAGKRLFAHLYKGYWRDVGTMSSFWDANMDLVKEVPPLNLYDPWWKIYYRHSFETPLYLSDSAKIRRSLVGEGGKIEGEVDNSVLFSDVVVEEGASIKDSIIMNGVTVKAGAKVNYTIVDHNTIIGEDACIGGSRKGGDPLTVIACELELSKGFTVSAGSTLEESK